MNIRKDQKILVAIAITFVFTNLFRDLVFIDTGKIGKKAYQVSKILEEYCLFDTDENTRTDFTCSALALSVGDHYTNYYSKEDFTGFNDNLNNSYFGLGITVSQYEDKLLIESIMEDSECKNLGIVEGDKIVSVDGEKITEDNASILVAKMREDDLKNPEGTTIVLSIEHNGNVKDYTITRKVIKSDSVKEKMIDDEIGYMKISSFSPKDYSDKDSFDTYAEFCASFKRLQDNGMKKLIIDLRNNPGGSLGVVTKIADEILPKGLITYMVDKKGKVEKFTSDSNELNIPICVLVNNKSASASEILTGALKDYKKATIIGETTYGKGIVQTIFPFSDGSGMSVTTAKYYTPNGVCIHKVGIEPDITVIQDENTEIDEQLEKAIEIIKTK